MWRPVDRLLGPRLGATPARLVSELARPGLERLLTAIRERRVERVVVYRLDRLTRSVHHWAQTAALLVEHRVGLTVVADGLELEDDAFSRFQFNLAAIAAELERVLIHQRQRDALRARRAHGLRSSGKLPLGYVAEPRTKQLVIEPREAEIGARSSPRPTRGRSP